MRSTRHASVLGSRARRRKAEETRCRARLLCPPSSRSRRGGGFQVSVVASVPSEQSSLSADVGFYATQGAVGAFFSLPGLERGNRRLDERVQCQEPHSPRGVLQLKRWKTCNSSPSTLDEAVARWACYALFSPNLRTHHLLKGPHCFALTNRGLALLVPASWPRKQPSRSALYYIFFLHFFNFFKSHKANSVLIFQMRNAKKIKNEKMGKWSILLTGRCGDSALRNYWCTAVGLVWTSAHKHTWREEGKKMWPSFFFFFCIVKMNNSCSGYGASGWFQVTQMSHE